MKKDCKRLREINERQNFVSSMQVFQKYCYTVEWSKWIILLLKLNCFKEDCKHKPCRFNFNFDNIQQEVRNFSYNHPESGIRNYYNLYLKEKQ